MNPAATLREILGVGEHTQGWVHPATPAHHINRWIAALNEGVEEYLRQVAL